MKKRAIGLLCLFFLILSQVFLSGCYLPVNWKMNHRPVISLDDQEITDKEVRLVALNNKSRFENYYRELYGSDFWKLKASQDLSYEDYVKEYFIFRELKAVLILNCIAKEQGIRLSMEDTEYLQEESEKFFNEMTADEKKYTGAALKDVYRLFYRYYLAEATEEFLLSDKKAEISEEESRVADIQVIRLSSYTKAEYILERVNNGESFLMLAQEMSEGNQISYSVAKGDLTPALDEVVFSMKDNEISDIIEDGDWYYIIRIDNAYDLLLSVKNSENLLAGKRFRLWEDVYEEMNSTHTIKREKDFWDTLTLDDEGDYPYHNLFSFLEK